jgi:hypothetical protein
MSYLAKLYLGSLISIILALTPILVVFGDRSAINAKDVTSIGNYESAVIYDTDISSAATLKHKLSLNLRKFPFSINLPLP